MRKGMECHSGANTKEEFEEIQMERSEKYKSGDVGNTNAAARGWQWLAGQKLIAAHCPPLPLTDFATKIPKSVCLWNWKTARWKLETRSKNKPKSILTISWPIRLMHKEIYLERGVGGVGCIESPKLVSIHGFVISWQAGSVKSGAGWKFSAKKVSIARAWW